MYKMWHSFMSNSTHRCCLQYTMQSIYSEHWSFHNSCKLSHPCSEVVHLLAEVRVLIHNLPNVCSQLLTQQVLWATSLDLISTEWCCNYSRKIQVAILLKPVACLVRPRPPPLLVPMLIPTPNLRQVRRSFFCLGRRVSLALAEGSSWQSCDRRFLHASEQFLLNNHNINEEPGLPSKNEHRNAFWPLENVFWPIFKSVKC